MPPNLVKSQDQENEKCSLTGLQMKVNPEHALWDFDK